MNPKKAKHGIVAIILTGLMITLPMAQAFAAKNRGRGPGYQGQGSKRMSVRQHNKTQHRKPQVKPPAQRPPAHRPPAYSSPKYQHRPPRYKGRYYKDYRAWRAFAGVTAAIAIGTMLATPPPQAQTVIIKERTYYLHDNVYYEPVLDGGRVVYQVVPSPY